MTNEQIQEDITLAFLAITPAFSALDIEGIGDEHITVKVHYPKNVTRVWECDIDSDDDGFFHFLLSDTTITLLVPYPEV